MTATKEILDELNLSNLPIEGKACLAALSEPEARSFLSLFGDSAKHPNLWSGSLDTFPLWSGAIYKGLPTHAAGFLQFEPGTYKLCVAATKRAPFHPQDQIINGWYLTQHDFLARSKLNLLLQLQIGRADLVPKYLYKVWGSCADGHFVARYNNNYQIFSQTPPPVIPMPPLSKDTHITISLDITTHSNGDPPTVLTPTIQVINT